MIGVQNGGWCASGPRAHRTFGKYGSRTNAVISRLLAILSSLLPETSFPWNPAGGRNECQGKEGCYLNEERGTGNGERGTGNEHGEWEMKNRNKT